MHKIPEILITLSPKLLPGFAPKNSQCPNSCGPGIFFEGPHQHSCGLFICECVVKSSSFYTPALYDGSWPGGACRTKCGCFWHHGSCLDSPGPQQKWPWPICQLPHDIKIGTKHSKEMGLSQNEDFSWLFPITRTLQRFLAKPPHRHHHHHHHQPHHHQHHQWPVSTIMNQYEQSSMI